MILDVKETGNGLYDDFSVWGSVTLDDPSGFAGLGAGIGLDYISPIKDKGFHFLLGMDAYRNPVKRITRQKFISDLDDDETIKFSSYYNFAPKVGFHYQTEVTDNMQLFGQAFALYDVLKITDSDFQYNLDFFARQRKFDFNLSGAFGFGFRIGTKINDKYSISLGYQNLGKHLISRTFTKVDYTDIEIQTGEDQKNISVLNLSVGFIF